ncbi:MAG: DUF4252 domain-containing protein [Bacteroides sp.]|nr:DUF4252 domain-containing protein [Bacteroides sp.]
MKTTNLKQTLARLTMIVVLACATTFVVKAQNIDYKKIAKMPGVEYTHISEFMAKLGIDKALVNIEVGEEKLGLKKFKGMHVIETENRESIKKILDIFKDIISGKDKKAEVLLNTIDDDEVVYIIRYTENEKKKEYTTYIITHEDEGKEGEELTIVAVRGELHLGELTE